MTGSRSAVVVARTALVGAVLGVAMGIIWWWVAPTELWTVVDGGLVPAEIDYTAWFAADAWFLVLGGVAGILLAAISWGPGRHRPVALAAGVIVGAVLAALAAWVVGGALGAPDPQTVAETADAGTTVPGALGIRAGAVVFGPALTSLTVLALLLSNARIDGPAEPAGGAPTRSGVPENVE